MRGTALSGTGGIWRVLGADGLTYDCSVRGRVKLGGLKLAVGDEVELPGDDPIFPVKLPVGEAGAATIAASAAMALSMMRPFLSAKGKTGMTGWCGSKTYDEQGYKSCLCPLLAYALVLSPPSTTEQAARIWSRIISSARERARVRDVSSAIGNSGPFASGRTASPAN